MTNTLHCFELINQKTFYLPRDSNLLATHIATIRWGLREFVYFKINSSGQTYIEEVILKPEITTNKLSAYYKYIEEDSLWNDLAKFLEEHNLTQMIFNKEGV